jgi:hypothetical protein
MSIVCGIDALPCGGDANAENRANATIAYFIVFILRFLYAVTDNPNNTRANTVLKP